MALILKTDTRFGVPAEYQRISDIRHDYNASDLVTVELYPSEEVRRRLPKPAPIDTVIHRLPEELRDAGRPEVYAWLCGEGGPASGAVKS